MRRRPLRRALRLFSFPPQDSVEYRFCRQLGVGFSRHIGPRLRTVGRPLTDVVSIPTRRRGHAWHGNHRLANAPRSYGAIHFIAMIEDIAWKDGCTWRVPSELRGDLRGAPDNHQGAEDFVPLFVLPSRKEWRASRFSRSTFTYLAYANSHHDRGSAVRAAMEP